ncbi:MFS transporter, DHA1 family, bicyclomycin/chloramphenicol resistance protein [Desulfuromusa kysingii]|uniref:MFS transporter, DHA1 family, bicyclomycin/chloramphenicol resistance protein n=1 Tax=Desulfuromusa kysingii TaxID=37625 RepID=A0A1H4BI70_9BACT|nr:multidrug effflux MFS transporter [Desulfuromusa kysingii]SEA47820.1 MFS transporter, DHA1 family, bicyclomycin/chloramphenicol resistance protein [Desulfuromusa kysingii]
MKTRHKFSGNVKIILFLALISAFPPLSTDLYLPALPQMVETLAASISKVNMTLSMFFIFYAGGLLFWGPLSEKYGRKPILLIGLTIYIVSSLLCGFAATVNQLILGRIFQAFGGSAATAIATAMVKDLYCGRERERVMALVMSMVIIAPIVAPVMGAILLKYISWRAVFYALAGIGIIAIAISSTMKETIEKRYSGSPLRSLGRLFVVLKNPQFAVLLAIFSVGPMTIMSFLSTSAFIYIDGFGLNEQQYSYFLAFNAAFALVGPMLYLQLSKSFTPRGIISGGFPLIICCGIAVMTLGMTSPWVFALCIALGTLVVTVMRVPGVNLMLDQQQQDGGSASALINFFGMIMGSLGMQLVSLNSHNLIWTLGSLQLLVGLMTGCLWLLIRNRPFVLQNVYKG